MIRRAEIALPDQVMQVTHRRDKAIGESGHVAHICLVRLGSHLGGISSIESERFLAQDMFTRARSRDSHRRMEHVRRGDDDRVDVIPLDDVFPIARSDSRAGMLTGGLQGVGVGVTQRGDFDVFAKGQARKMVLQRDTASTDDGKIQCAHESNEWGAVWRGAGNWQVQEKLHALRP